MDRKIIFNRMRRNPFFMIGVVGSVFIVLMMVLAPVITHYDPLTNSLMDRFIAPEYLSNNGLEGHVLGTDQLGRDVFTRLLYGGRYSLVIALVVVCLQVLIGTTLGLCAGFFGGWVDAVVMRLCEVFLAIPPMIMAVAVMAVFGASLSNLIVVLVITGWVHCCKVTRNNVLVVKKQEFVHASQVLGAKKGHIMFKQILPNVLTSIIIIGTQRIGMSILAEAGLSFLNLGIQPPTPSWGNMISVGRAYLTTQPWMVFAPGVAMMITVLSFNMLGDGLRDVLDPKQL